MADSITTHLVQVCLPIAIAKLLASIIIPVAPFHLDLAQRAVKSAEAQTKTVEIIVVEDKEQRGAAWARNKGIEKASAPFTIFLDADDEIQTEFVEKTVIQWLQREHELTYVYTDWRLGDTETIRYHDGGNYFELGMYHIITTLIPTQAAKRISFDTSLPTLEDEDYYFQLATMGFCGKRTPECLVYYHAAQGRSGSNPARPTQRDLIKQAHKIFWQRYGVYKHMACNCGKGSKRNLQVVGTPEKDFVIAMPLYSPAKREGRATGYKYPRSVMGQPMYVHPADIQANPNWWRVVADPKDINPDVGRVMELVNA